MNARTERGLMMLGIAAMLAAIVVALSPPPTPDRAELAELHVAIEQRWVEAFASGDLARDDGCVYTVDVGHLLVHAALKGDRALYDRVAPTARKLVRDDRSDPYTKGFVPWRMCGETAADASGTTEALRVARGLWLGANAFDVAADRTLTVTILHGYRRHAAIDHGVWMVRNYFNFQTRAFANDSYLVDYDPDFVAEVAEATDDAVLATLAEQSYALVKAAVAPTGLIHTLVQPDVATILPKAPVPIFSPNDVIQVNNACTVAETVVRGAPEVARRLIDFALDRGRGLKRAYHGRDGTPVDDTPADSTAWSCLVRVAILLGDDAAAARFVDRALWGWRWLVKSETLWPYSLGEALLAMDVLMAAPDSAVGVQGEAAR